MKAYTVIGIYEDNLESTIDHTDAETPGHATDEICLERGIYWLLIACFEGKLVDLSDPE